MIRKLTFIGTLPPPIHGQSIVTSALLQALTAVGVDITVFNTSPTLFSPRWKQLLLRTWATSRAAMYLILTSSKQENVYTGIDSGTGMWANLFHVMIVAVGRKRIFVHHHSNSYIESHNHIMELLTYFGAARCTHIFLTEVMKSDFTKIYPKTVSSYVCSNAYILKRETIGSECFPAHSVLRLCLLSNLCAEKGLYEFMNVVRELRRRGVAVVGHLAGPVRRASEQFDIDQTIIELRGHLVYEGPVYNEAKMEFLRRMHVFVFPTNYRIEYYPTVLLEAMAAGLAIVTVRRGGIPEMLAQSKNVVVSSQSDFVSSACDVISAWESNRAALIDTQKASIEAVRDIYDTANEQKKVLIDHMTVHSSQPNIRNTFP